MWKKTRNKDTGLNKCPLYRVNQVYDVRIIEVIPTKTGNVSIVKENKK